MGGGQWFNRRPHAVATDWGFKVKLWMTSLWGTCLMETAVRRLKLMVAENTLRWSDGNWATGWTAEHRLMLFILYWKRLRRFLNGEDGRHRWRDEVKEHRMGGEGEEVEKRWICSDSDLSLSRRCLTHTYTHRYKFNLFFFVFSFGYVFTQCGNAVYAQPCR